MKKITVIGSLNIDFVVEVKHMPVAGETILTDGFTLVPGGKGANQAFALGRMGANVTMLGAVGKDAYGDVLLKNLVQADVDISHVAHTDLPTGIALISVDETGNNSIIVIQGANRSVTREYIDSKMDILKASDVVILQLEIPLETVVYVATIAKQLGKTVILDPAPAPSYLSDELLQQLDIIKPNELELAALTNMTNIRDNLEEACNQLLNRGVGCVLASIGSDGVFVAMKDKQPRIFPCEQVPVVDTTAAGDSFTAAIAFAITNGEDIYSAAQFANQIATVVISRKGAQSSIPTKQEVDAIWQSRQILV